MKQVSAGHRTSSIPRPRAGRVRAALPSLRATSDMGDDTRLVVRRRNRNVFAVAGSLVVAALAAALLVLPVRTWIAQRTELAEREGELAALEAANEELRRANERLGTSEGVEEAARSELGMAAGGEETRTVLPAPAGDGALPGRWPYTVVAEIFEVRERAALSAATPAATAAP